MATHSSILVWKIPQTEEPDGLQYMGSQRVRLDRAHAHTHTHTHTHSLEGRNVSILKNLLETFRAHAEDSS